MKGIIVTLTSTTFTDRVGIRLTSSDEEKPPSISIVLDNDRDIEGMLATNQDVAEFIERELQDALSNILLFVAAAKNGKSTFSTMLDILSESYIEARKVQLAEILGDEGKDVIPLCGRA
jgi:hypothetical protein